MSTTPMFTLKACGYLLNIVQEKDKFFARIKAIDSTSTDHIYMDCEITGLVQEHLLNLLMKVKTGHSVIVNLEAQYCKFIHSSTCFTRENENCTDHIVNLRCKIYQLGNCYIDGSLVDQQYFRFLKAA